MLKRPTPELIEKQRAKFDRKERVVEHALQSLIRRFPENVHESHVLLKVVSINELYHSRVLGKDLRKLAHRIRGLDIDSALKDGSPKAVQQIANCCGTREYYSFATKFCSWHNQSAYSIWDGHVDEALWAYKKQHNFADFHRQDMWDYEKFAEIIKGFQKKYELDTVPLKQLDKFLWHLGDRILKRRAKLDAAKPS